MGDDSDEKPAARGALSGLMAIPTTAIFAISLILAIAVLFVTGTLDGVLDAIGDANVTMLVVAAPIYLASLWILAFRWHMLVRMASGSSNLPRAAEAFFTSVVINYAAPVGLAVPSRAALTKRALGLNADQTGAIALWEIAFDVLVLGSGTAIWLILTEGAAGDVRDGMAQSTTSYLLAGIVVVAVLVAVSIVAARKPDLRRRLFEITGRIVSAPSRQPAAAALTLIVSALYWVLQGVVLWMLVVALGVDVSAAFILGFTALPILVGMLSPIPGGSGVRELLMYVVARSSGYGAEADAIVAAALIYRFALFAAIPLLFGVNKLWLRAQRESQLSNHGDAIDERTPSG